MRAAACLALGVALACAGVSRAADTLRVATYNADLSRSGPGLLLRDILAEDTQVTSAARVIARVRPDILLITKFDFDYDQVALSAFAELLAARDTRYPHRFALLPNTGMRTGRDMDGDGRRATPDDAQGWGRFAGEAGMAVLSRLPIAAQQARDFSDFLWRDLPDSLINAGPTPPAPARAIQRLSTTGHWDVPVRLPDGRRLNLLAFYATPPVFGGDGKINARRNHDEVRFWSLLLDGRLPFAPPEPPFVILGDSNLDPNDGDGMNAAMRRLLDHPALQDPRPLGAGGAAADDGPLNAAHTGDPALDTTHWPQSDGPGNLRVDYVLPSADLEVVDAGVFWPAPGSPQHALLGRGEAAASRHRLVWVDIALADR